jgi:L-lactate utilization protein LutB
MKGKDKCEFLKGIRKRMAEANGIPYEPRECTYEGKCTGTCPFCEKEAAELMAELRKKEAEGGEIKTDDASILAIELLQHCERNDFHDANKEESHLVFIAFLEI